jgi:hypothetical protein
MATNDDYLRLRRMTGEDDGESKYKDTDLDDFIQRAAGDLNLAASLVWGEKASAVADLVNINESGSSRSLSDLFDHAKKQADYFGGLSTDADTPTAASGSTTRRIVRA